MLKLNIPTDSSLSVRNDRNPVRRGAGLSFRYEVRNPPGYETSHSARTNPHVKKKTPIRQAQGRLREESPCIQGLRSVRFNMWYLRNQYIMVLWVSTMSPAIKQQLFTTRHFARPILHYSQKANKLLYLLVSVMLRTKACKNSICLLFSGACTSGHLLRCESLEPSHSYIIGK